MLKKEDNRKFVMTGVVVVIVLMAILYIFRISVSNFVVSAYINSFGLSSDVNLKADLSLTERDELEKLRVENKTLKGDMSDLKKEINLIEDGLEPTYVKMLGKQMSYYNTFYVTYPKDKTVYKGMNIYSHGNVLVGQVEEVLKDSLLVSRLGQTNTFLAESQDVKEQIELGALGGGEYVGQLVAGSKISVGDNIVLKGYPKSVVGIVSEIVNNENTNSNIFVRTPYNVFSKEIFYVLQ